MKRYTRGYNKQTNWMHIFSIKCVCPFTNGISWQHSRDCSEELDVFVTDRGEKKLSPMGSSIEQNGMAKKDSCSQPQSYLK